MKRNKNNDYNANNVTKEKYSSKGNLKSSQLSNFINEFSTKAQRKNRISDNYKNMNVEDFLLSRKNSTNSLSQKKSKLFLLTFNFSHWRANT